MKTLTDINLKGARVLIRVDFNVPLNDAFEVTDATRIIAAKPTILKVLEAGGSCVLISHLGRPKGREPQFSLEHIVSKVSDILGVKVHFIADTIGDQVDAKKKALQAGEVLLLENLRYYPEETAGDQNFASQLIANIDYYINDAFGTAHRAHASTTIAAQLMPNKKAAGLLLQKEVENVEKVFKHAEKPVVAIIGGAKVSSKIGIITNLFDIVDHLIIGGGMAFTFLKALGSNVGNSLVENDKLTEALNILKLAEARNTKIHLPQDVIASDTFSENGQVVICNASKITSGFMGLDVGPETIKEFNELIANAKTILWNGPMGVFEMASFAKGTKLVGEAIAEATQKGAFSLVGGGDSVAAAKQFGLTNSLSYISTGGGAMLEMLEGKTLPGVAALA